MDLSDLPEGEYEIWLHCPTEDEEALLGVIFRTDTQPQRAVKVLPQKTRITFKVSRTVQFEGR